MSGVFRLKGGGGQNSTVVWGGWEAMRRWQKRLKLETEDGVSLVFLESLGL